MTRINLVPPEELMDQHLIAEYREITMVPAALRRSLKSKPWSHVKTKIPKQFTLNAGHVSHFYDKLGYLIARFDDIHKEMVRRGFKSNATRFVDSLDQIPEELQCLGYEWQPTEADLSLIRERIELRISQKPGWYRRTEV